MGGEALDAEVRWGGPASAPCGCRQAPHERLLSPRAPPLPTAAFITRRSGTSIDSAPLAPLHQASSLAAPRASQTSRSLQGRRPSPCGLSSFPAPASPAAHLEVWSGVRLDGDNVLQLRARLCSAVSQSVLQAASTSSTQPRSSKAARPRPAPCMDVFASNPTPVFADQICAALTQGDCERQRRPPAACRFILIDLLDYRSIPCLERLLLKPRSLSCFRLRSTLGSARARYLTHQLECARIWAP